MRYVIVGAGGIGGAIGARLAETGRDVILVARGAHAAAMKAEGLRLSIPERVIVVHPPVAQTVGELALRMGDVLILAVKGQDAPVLMADLAALPVSAEGAEQPIGLGTAGESLPIYCAQNGLNNERAALRHFAHVHGMEVSLQATFLEPGRVSSARSPYTGILEVGVYPAGSDELDARVAADLNDSGFLATVREDVMAWKRAKLLRNLNNALDALCGRRPDDQASLDAVRDAMVAEATQVYAAAGLSLVDADEFTPHKAKSRFLPVEGRSSGGGSTWQSVTRGLGSVETDYLNGEIVLLGRLHSVPTPVNERVQQRMAVFIRSGGRPGDVAPAELLS